MAYNLKGELMNYYDKTRNECKHHKTSNKGEISLSIHKLVMKYHSFAVKSFY